MQSNIQVLTFPCRTSSLWAAEAALTRAVVAVAIDLAASRICSSKFKLSSTSWNSSKSDEKIRTIQSNLLCLPSVSFEVGAKPISWQLLRSKQRRQEVLVRQSRSDHWDPPNQNLPNYNREVMWLVNKKQISTFHALSWMDEIANSSRDVLWKWNQILFQISVVWLLADRKHVVKQRDVTVRDCLTEVECWLLLSAIVCICCCCLN